MEQLVLISASVAFILAVLEQLVDIRRFKAVISLAGSACFAFLVGLRGAVAVETVLGAAFFAPFFIALADRLVAIPLTVSRALGQPR